MARTLALAAQGAAVDLLHAVDEREDVPIAFELAAAKRAQPEALLARPQLRRPRQLPYQTGQLGLGLRPLRRVVSFPSYGQALRGGPASCSVAP